MDVYLIKNSMINTKKTITDRNQ